MAPESRPEEQSSGSDVPAHLLCSPSTCSRRRRRRRPGGRVPSEAALTGGSDQRAPQERQHGSTQVRCSGVCVTTVCVSPYMMRVTELRFLFKFLFFFFSKLQSSKQSCNNESVRWSAVHYYINHQIYKKYMTSIYQCELFFKEEKRQNDLIWASSMWISSFFRSMWQNLNIFVFWFTFSSLASLVKVNISCKYLFGECESHIQIVVSKPWSDMVSKVQVKVNYSYIYMYVYSVLRVDRLTTNIWYSAFFQLFFFFN